ncbi:MAG: CDP-glucose 4,6-dehydratase [Endomicrobium sp.]|jgi:CDP-glucose 4,6-dehydratase|nr:CDP-glucose 4,6-dehydratase [Endomicrobium sp.]
MISGYKNKKVFITGHTGFKGSWLALWLTQLGAKICGYALKPNTEPSMFNILGLEKIIERHIEGDIRDFDKLNIELNKFSPDIVFHMAAQPLVRISYKEPLETYQTNVLGTVNILEVVRRNEKVKAVVNVTTDKCYKNKGTAYKETDELGGYDPYSSSKACSELVTSSYRDSFFNVQDFGRKHNTLLATARSGNVIGGGDYSLDRLIPDFVKSVQKNQNIILRNTHAIRPWQFVLEPIRGYILLGEKLLNLEKQYADAYNFGPEEASAISVEEFIKKAISFWGKGGYKEDVREQPHEAKVLKLDISKAKKELNWFPCYNIDGAVKYTIEWYKAYYEGVNMNDFSLNQISIYSKYSNKQRLC